MDPVSNPGRRAVVTGASEGIGRAFAMQLAAAGYRVTLMARNAERLQAVADALPGAGHSVLAVDLATPSGADAAARQLEQAPVDVLVNNAGATFYGNFGSVSWERQEHVLALNCRALARLSHAFIAHAKPGATLVNVSSVVAFMPQPTSAMYSASKAFVTALCEALASECHSRNIYVLGLHPGITTATQFRSRGGGTATRAFWAVDANEVARAGMAALAQRRRTIVIVGRFNKLLTAAVRFAPRGLWVRALGRLRRRGV